MVTSYVATLLTLTLIPLFSATGDTSFKKFKLSDLPVLKKWEIPNHQFSKPIGRKYKDLDREIKRSAYWELKPVFTANELEWDEDPEKVKLDFNYKDFLEEDEEHDIEHSTLTEKPVLEAAQSRDVTGDKRNLVSTLNKKQKKRTTGKKKRSKLHIKKAKKHKRGRRSVDDAEEEETLDNGQNAFITDGSVTDGPVKDGPVKRSVIGDGEELDDFLFPNRFFMDNIADGDEVDNEISERRAAIWDAVRRLQLSQGNNKHGEPAQRRLIAQQKEAKRQAVHYPTPLITRKPKLPLHNDIFKRSHVVFPKLATADLELLSKAKKVSRSTIEGHRKSGELGDEHLKKDKMKALEALKSTRQNIGRPDSNAIDPSNVAKAVSMAMEQLKRDHMWGKVFVHVKPNGQLKVMVQETKKMDD